jgi:ureidoglycolate lyase
MIIKVQALEQKAFAPFGQVLAWSPGDPVRRDFAAKLFSDRPTARPNLRVQRAEPVLLPHTATLIERHRHSSQMFAPLSGGSFLIMVFLSNEHGQPILQSGLAFVGSGNQAINYNVDTWHHPFLALEAPGTFLTQRWEDGTSGDEEFLPLTTPICIEEPFGQSRFQKIL